MKLQDTQITNYLTFCKTQKCLDEKTIRAYKIDLTQFSSSMSAETSLYDITSRQLEAYIAHLHSIYKPKTSKRKIASLKAFFHYCEFYEFIEKNPFDKIQIRFREPIILPKTIPLQTLDFSSLRFTPNGSLPLHLTNKKMHCVTPLSLNCFLPPESAFPNCAV